MNFILQKKILSNLFQELQSLKLIIRIILILLFKYVAF